MEPRDEAGPAAPAAGRGTQDLAERVRANARPDAAAAARAGRPPLLAKLLELREPLLTMGLCVLVVVVPWFSGDLYYRSVTIQIFIYIALAVSYQMLFGYARLVSFGHAAFFGLSAYTSGVLVATYGVPHVLAWLAGVAVTMLVALVAGRIVIRLEPLLLAVATLAFSQIVVLIVSQLSDVTGGQNGLVTVPLTVGSTPPADFNYWFVAAGMLLVVGATVALVNSPVGRLLLAVGDDPVGARSLGANPTRVLVFAFVVSSGLAGVAGVLLAQSTAVLAPESIGLDTSILVLAMIAVGGLRSLPGAVVGAVLLALIPVVFASLQQAAVLVYGGILLVVFVVSPEGLAGLPALWARYARRAAR